MDARQEWGTAQPVPILPDVMLADDGTLDTVFHCCDCGQELRYSSEAFDRDEETGALVSEPDALRQAAEDHSDECEPESEEG